ncbi:ORF6N domain-containing protein [Salibacter halophilus]|uniref:ORF6N domain-containing protein n=1 Tax=Salibacter halophilus TaxID=1803916 RepID=A0A6N6M5G5_9FLAO|nr:ORF6N domain-containing protein [Salibacter halophilus]KAB1064763.1 ORF6N domain-containing protein [Salibacter halophilus]
MSKELAISQKQIESRIFSIRGNQVMIDRDLAEMYQVETRVLNQAVKRNLNRFPEKFRFQLTEEEFADLESQISASNSRSQIVTSKNEDQNLKSQTVTSSEHGGRRYLPYAFTEQGVAMLSAVLRSDIAVQVSIQIMDAFVEMRKFIANNSGLLQRMEGIERKQIETDQKFEQVFKALENKDNIPTQGVFFDGQIFDAYELASKIIRSATSSIVLIDNYVNDTTLTHLSKKAKGVQVHLLTKSISKQLKLDVQKANEQYGNFEAKPFTQSHDRFLIIDDKEVFHLGASLKDLGKKWFAFSKMRANSVENIMNSISELI